MYGRPARALGILLVFWTATAFAQSRVFVSTVAGNDSNACTVISPCRSFAKAISVVSPSGEILALDSGGYGPFGISQSVSVVAPPGIEASITQGTPGADAIDINGSSAVVVLQGLSFFGLGAGQAGIYAFSAGSVSVHGCVFNGFAAGIVDSAGSLTSLTVTDSAFLHNSGNGIETIASANDLVYYAIDHSRFEQNGFAGLNAFQGSRGTVSNSLFAGNATGLLAQAQSAGQTSVMTIENCIVTGGTYGISTFGNGTNAIRVSNSVIVHNTNGVAGTSIVTRQNNTLDDNGTDGTFAGPYSAR